MKTAALLAKLELLSHGLAARHSMVDQGDSLIFHGGRIFTYNDELMVSVSSDSDVSIQGAVKAEALTKLLKKIKTAELELSDGEGEIHIAAGRTKAGVRYNEEIMIPIEDLPDPSDGKWADLPSDLLTGMALCCISTGVDVSMPELTCIHVHGNRVQSCDNFRATRFELKDDPGDLFAEPLLIPANKVRSIAEMDPVRVNVATNSSWVHFENEDGMVVSCRTFNEEYPNLDSLFDFEATPIELPNEILGALDRAGVFARDDVTKQELVHIDLKGKQLTLRSESTDGWVEESVQVKYKGDALSVLVDPVFLQEILVHQGTVAMGQSMMRFTGEQFVHIFALEVPEEEGCAAE